jgi:hypothetical protein
MFRRLFSIAIIAQTLSAAALPLVAGTATAVHAGGDGGYCN